MRLLVDSNIIIDYLCKREPFFQSAKLLMTLGQLHEFNLWFTSAQANDIFYVTTHGVDKLDSLNSKTRIKGLRTFMQVIGVDAPTFDRALNSDWDDLEDACVYFAARSIRADAIITRNQRDFAQSDIPVFDCDGFFDWMHRTYDVDYASVDF